MSDKMKIDKDPKPAPPTARGATDSKSPALIEPEAMFRKWEEIARETAEKAFELFRLRNGEQGTDLDDWFAAERQLLRSVPVEISETDGKVDVRAAVPGFRPEEIEVSIHDNVLTMTGQTETREEHDRDNVLYTDWHSNRFFRQIPLPVRVDARGVAAELKDGVLQLSLPKTADAGEETKVSVQAA